MRSTCALPLALRVCIALGVARAPFVTTTLSRCPTFRCLIRRGLMETRVGCLRTSTGAAVDGTGAAVDCKANEGGFGGSRGKDESNTCLLHASNTVTQRHQTRSHASSSASPLPSVQRPCQGALAEAINECDNIARSCRIQSAARVRLRVLVPRDDRHTRTQE